MGTRKGNGPDGDTLSPMTRAKIASQHNGANVVDHSVPRNSSFAEGELMLRDLNWLLARGDGWMRWTSDMEGKTVFLKYKFTSLHWPNHYVFVSGPVYDIALWVGALVRKCEKVDSGDLKPTQDKPYNHM